MKRIPNGRYTREFREEAVKLVGTGRGPDTRKPPRSEWPKCSIWMVGARGFEPPAPCSRSQIRPVSLRSSKKCVPGWMSPDALFPRTPMGL